MIIKYSNLSDERKIFLNKELADILYLCRKNKVFVSEEDIVVIALSNDVDIPEKVREKIVINQPEKEREPENFDLLCEREINSQTSQIIKHNNQIWVIGNGEIGAIYGFYQMIKNITGIRWYGISPFDIAFAKVSNNLELLHKPLVAFRGFEFSPSMDSHHFNESFLKWMVRNGWNLLDINAIKWENYPGKERFINLCRTYGIKLAIGCHAVDFFVPEQLFDQCPEFFGLREGKRVITEIVGSPDIKKRWKSHIQPCFTNPRLREFLVNSIVNFINLHPEMSIFSLWPHDGINNWCQCDNCRKQSPYEMLYTLAIEISEKLGRFFPIELLCYSNMFNLPKNHLPFSNNTYTLFCPYLRHYHHNLFEEGFEKSCLTLGIHYPEPDPINPSDDREYGILLKQWLEFLKDIGSRFGVFSYYQLVFHDQTEKSDRSRYLYHPEPDLVEDEIKKFINSGMKVFYDCSPPYPGFWPDARFYAYLSSLFWEKTLSVDKIINEYYRAIAGERAEVLKNILKTISSYLDKDVEIPRDTIETAKSIFNCLPDTIARRYILWLEYVIVGKQSWIALKKGNMQEMINKEKQIIEFFENNRFDLDDFINVDYMIRYSRSVIEFYSNES